MYYWLRVSCGIVVVPTRLRDGAMTRRTERNRARERVPCRRKISRRNISRWTSETARKKCQEKLTRKEKTVQRTHRIHPIMPNTECRCGTLKFVNHSGVREA